MSKTYSSIYNLKTNIAGYSWNEKKTDFTAQANEAYYVSTSLSNVLMELPANPTPGDEVAFLIVGTNKLNITTINKIKGSLLAADFVKQAAQPYLMFIFFYVDNITGWNWDSRYDAYIADGYIGAGDPYFNNVVLFLKGDGANNSTSIIDSSPNPKVATASGTAKISTAQSKYGGSSYFFDGTNNCYINIISSPALNRTNQSFTEEAYIYLTGYPANNGGYYYACIAGKDSSIARECSFIAIGTANSYTGLNFGGFVNGSPNGVTGNFNFVLNTWYHVAASRSENILMLFVNGLKIAEGNYNFNIDATSTSHKVGALQYSSTYPYYFKGNIDSYRLTIGKGRYITNFNPETDTFLNL